MTVTDSLELFSFSDEPDFLSEQRLMDAGCNRVAGVDEAGRGPLAGPVVAAAVILDPRSIPHGVNDSKKLTQSQREALFTSVLASGICAWACMPAQTIDALNIRAATLHAMEKAVWGLAQRPDAVLIDGRDVPRGLHDIGTALIKGDARSVSIAAASIVAKTVRDRIMIEAAEHFPGYGFEKHKGYGSKYHRTAIERLGPCSIHRMSFAPMRLSSNQVPAETR